MQGPQKTFFPAATKKNLGKKWIFHGHVGDSQVRKRDKWSRLVR